MWTGTSNAPEFVNALYAGIIGAHLKGRLKKRSRGANLCLIKSVRSSTSASSRVEWPAWHGIAEGTRPLTG